MCEGWLRIGPGQRGTDSAMTIKRHAYGPQRFTVQVLNTPLEQSARHQFATKQYQLAHSFLFNFNTLSRKRLLQVVNFCMSIRDATLSITVFSNRL